MIIDTHSHIYYKEGEKYGFAEDIELVIDRAKEEGVKKILLPNVDLESYPLMLELTSAYPEMCHPMIGLHPTSVGSDYLQVLQFLEGELKKDASRFIAIGEIGLDYHWDMTYKAEMQDAFRRQIEWALEYHLPVSVHSRDAEDDCLSILKEYEGLKGVVHAFGGNRKHLEKALALDGFMVGITGVLTFKNSGLAKVIKGALPLERLVIETDAPYLAPSPYRGKRNEPSYLKYIIRELARLYECTEEEVRRQVFENSAKMFNLAV